MTTPINCRSIMLDFATSSGLSNNSREPRRYLWTDAFAVCNFLELYRQSGEQFFLDLALKLVEQVHDVLGNHRPDGGCRGSLSGLEQRQARLQPTIGGLRIGKPLDERQPGEPSDASREWDQDGQYFHYLTKWMHALYCVGRETGKYRYLRWALELAKTAHKAFTYTPPTGGARRMYWKMSIDLSRPLVDSMGQHDPLDGLITYLQLDTAADRKPGMPGALKLDSEINEMREMCTSLHCPTGDPLGIGGLLTDAFRLVQLIDTHHLQETARLASLLDDIEYSLRAFVAQNPLSLPAEHRHAFRELGLTIGLHAISRMQHRISQNPESFSGAQQLTAHLNDLSAFRHVHEFVEDFWLKPTHRANDSWRHHADINNVMLATTLAPDGYLQL